MGLCLILIFRPGAGRFDAPAGFPSGIDSRPRIPHQEDDLQVGQIRSGEQLGGALHRQAHRFHHFDGVHGAGFVQEPAVVADCSIDGQTSLPQVRVHLQDVRFIFDKLRVIAPTADLAPEQIVSYGRGFRLQVRTGQIRLAVHHQRLEVVERGRQAAQQFGEERRPAAPSRHDEDFPRLIGHRYEQLLVAVHAPLDGSQCARSAAVL